MAKDDSFLTLKKQIKEDGIGNLYLFFGEEIFVKDMYLEKMKSFIPDGGFADFNSVYLEAGDMTPDKIDDALNSFPMMSDKKLVMIKDSGIFKSANQDIKEYWQKQLADVERCIANGVLTDDLKDFQMVYDETVAIVNKGVGNIHKAMEMELGSICERILKNTAVFKDDSQTIAFMQGLGFQLK